MNVHEYTLGKVQDWIHERRTNSSQRLIKECPYLLHEERYGLEAEVNVLDSLENYIDMLLIDQED